MNNDTESRIIDIAKAVLSCPVNQESDMTNTPEWDSLKKIDLLLTIEEEFAITFDQSTIGSLSSISSLISATEDLIKRKNQTKK
jgi:acyl carrier protein